MLPKGDWNIQDARVLEAIRSVPRAQFVPAAQLESAEDDRPLPIGRGQTISQPYIVALMSEALAVEPHHRVLEIGTGSGYQAAVLSRLAAEVYSVERIAELADSAERRLGRLGVDNVRIRHGDGAAGWPEEAPFDRIIVTAACRRIPANLTDQLAPGGILLLPLGRKEYQYLVRGVPDGKGGLSTENLLAVRFVPFRSGLE